MKPLEIAIKMETDGKEFYLKASRKASDKLGKELFAQLAKEEDFHAAKAREISDLLKLGENPLAIEESLDHGRKLNSIFSRAKGELEAKSKGSETELEAIHVALEMEEKSRIFYEEQSSAAQTEPERRFFKALMQEEQGHYLSLVDYREYLIDPAGWFAKSEHVSLDGA